MKKKQYRKMDKEVLIELIIKKNKQLEEQQVFYEDNDFARIVNSMISPKVDAILSDIKINSLIDEERLVQKLTEYQEGK